MELFQNLLALASRVSGNDLLAVDLGRDIVRNPPETQNVSGDGQDRLTEGRTRAAVLIELIAHI